MAVMPIVIFVSLTEEDLRALVQLAGELPITEYAVKVIREHIERASMDDPGTCSRGYDMTEQGG